MDITATREIDAPVELVWAVMSDVARMPEWTVSIKKVDLLDGPTISVGGRARVRQPGFPPVVWTVTQVMPGESFIWESRTPGLVSTGRHSVRPWGSGAVVELGISQVGRLERVARMLFGKRSRRFVEMEADGLKRRCEERR